MYARVTHWEGGQADAMRRSGEEMRTSAASGPPDGVPATGFTLLMDPEAGTSIAIALFPTEADLRQGDATLNQMAPMLDAGRRVDVQTYEVAVDVRA